MWLIGYLRWFRHCYVVARIFWVACRACSVAKVFKVVRFIGCVFSGLDVLCGC